MPMFCVFDMCLPVSIENGHLHQNDVTWDLLYNKSLLISFSVQFEHKMLILGVFDICLPVFIDNGHLHQNDVNWEFLDNMSVLISFSASI